MEIGWPTNVEHVAHVTFDRFNGFLGLPSEFEPDVPRKAPSASSTVFGVSTESMQLSYDSRGNCVPVILLLMQSHLYSLGGLQTEGIFRLAADNSEEEHIREQLNKGVIPDGTDVHCLAGLIKAWFRELPKGILDSLSTEKVMQCETEGDFVELVRLLPQTEAYLLNWAIHLMADVVHNEHLNKMNSRNIALVFAPNMSKMAEPLTALMYAIQVMNLLKTLVERTLRERERASFRTEDVVEEHEEEEEDDDNDDDVDDDDTVYVVYDAYDNDAHEEDNSGEFVDEATEETPDNQNASNESGNGSENPTDFGKMEIRRTGVSETENFLKKPPQLQQQPELPVPAETRLQLVPSSADAEHSA